jgi:hypothetical protein
VFADRNDLKPMQNVTAKGRGGENYILLYIIVCPNDVVDQWRKRRKKKHIGTGVARVKCG